MSITITSLCREVNNWFERSRHEGTYHIVDGAIDLSELAGSGAIQEGQYFRILNSVFNDGVHQYVTENETEDVLTDETFDGIVAPMALPIDFLDLFNEINGWLAKYEEDLQKPYQSESFGGYSYSLKGSFSGGTGSNSEPWKAMFAAKLNKWRKLP